MALVSVGSTMAMGSTMEIGAAMVAMGSTMEIGAAMVMGGTMVHTFLSMSKCTLDPKTSEGEEEKSSLIDRCGVFDAGKKPTNQILPNPSSVYYT